MSSFEVDIESGSCSLSFENLNPKEMRELANRLSSNANMIIALKEWDPIEVMSDTLRRDDHMITFQLSYTALPIEIDRGWPTCPEPNVMLTEEQQIRYVELFNQVII